MRIPFLLTATALFASTARAQDDESPYYLQFNVGAVASEEADVGGSSIGFDPGFTTGITLGRTYELDESWDFEAEFETFYQYFTADEDDVGNIEDDVKTLAFMLNGNLDWKFTPQYSVYGGVGFGWAKEIDYASFDTGNLRQLDDDGLAFQAKIGLSYNLGGAYDARIGYRYFKTEPIDIEEQTPPNPVEELDIAQHSLEVGFRWSL